MEDNVTEGVGSRLVDAVREADILNDTTEGEIDTEFAVRGILGDEEPELNTNVYEWDGVGV